jgi:hypothetical protein
LNHNAAVPVTEPFQIQRLAKCRRWPITGVARFCRTVQVLRLRCYNQAQRRVSWQRRPHGKSVYSVVNTVKT